VFVGSLTFPASGPAFSLTLGDSRHWPAYAAGWLFVAGVVLFSGSLYVLSLTGKRSWGAVTPLGGASLVLGWAFLLFAVVVA